MCCMADLHNDTPDLRAWLASQLKLKDVPEEIWDKLVKSRHVTEAQDPDLAKGRENLLTEARDLIRIYRAGSGFPKVNKKQRSRKRQRASDRSRLDAEAEIAAKIGKARAKKSGTTTSNGDEVNLRRLPVAGMISNNQITITAEPWVSPEDVRREYKSLQDSWFWKPTPSERRVQLLRFVVRFCETRFDEKRNIATFVRGASWPGWRRIMEQWNQRYPQDHDWHYKDVRNFQRDARETFEALTLFKVF
jgi:hypothetical protein